MPYFSVLISVYYKEKAEYLDSALKSVLINQTLKPTELVLVADGKLTHELYLVIGKYKKIFSNFNLVQLPQNVGLGRALNEGLKHCSYDWVARMDSDDISTPDRFEKQYEYIKSHPNVSVIGSWVSEFQDYPQNITSIKKVPEIHTDILQYARSRNPINHPVVFFNKLAVLSVGGYEHCPLFEDYWLWVRLLQNKIQFYNIQKSLLLFRANSLMYERRGGLTYIKDECNFLYKTRKLGFINTFTFIKNIAIRSCFRIIPNNIRTILYQRILRKK